MELINILKSKQELTKNELDYIVTKTNNREDYITLNYIEKRLIAVQGKNFMIQNHNKIQYIMSMILKEDIDLLYEFYNGCFQEYLKLTNNIKGININAFNLTFAALINISIKIIREYKE